MANHFHRSGERVTLANLNGASDLLDADLKDADLKGADFRDADLKGADLKGADLRGADLRGADLWDADLWDADLWDANLGGANLGDADLRGADLRGANLRGANLWDANLGGADLRGANLGGANFGGCNGNMTHIKSLVCEQYPVTYTVDVMQIGCHRHPIADWWGFDDKTILEMGGKTALKWWRTWKPILKQIIETAPAEATGHQGDGA